MLTCAPTAHAPIRPAEKVREKASSTTTGSKGICASFATTRRAGVGVIGGDSGGHRSDDASARLWADHAEFLARGSHTSSASLRDG